MAVCKTVASNKSRSQASGALPPISTKFMNFSNINIVMTLICQIRDSENVGILTKSNLRPYDEIGSTSKF